MKTIKKFYLILTVSLFLTNCSHDSIDSETQNTDFPQEIVLQDVDIPMEPLADIGAVALTGFPKTIKKFENGILKYWAQYYYRPDGNLIKVNYGYDYPKSESDELTNAYQYDSEGKMVKYFGNNNEYNFYWDNGRIIWADVYNLLWPVENNIFYEYNDQGQIIQKKENHDVTDTGYSHSTFTKYSYYENGNLKLIEYYSWNRELGAYGWTGITTFDGYNKDENLFFEEEIIPGQHVQHQFPTSKTKGDYMETYYYEYDTNGKVMAKAYANNKVTYDYY